MYYNYTNLNGYFFKFNNVKLDDEKFFIRLTIIFIALYAGITLNLARFSSIIFNVTEIGKLLDNGNLF